MEKNKTEESRQGENKDEKPEKSSFRAEIWDFVKVFIVTALLILLFVNFVAHPVTVFGHSMDPTLANGEYGFTSRISTYAKNFGRGDVVVVKMEDNGQKDYWVKRIIGLPGETIECVNGIIYIDGNALEEPWLDEEYMQSFVQTHQLTSFTEDFPAVTLAQDEYFVMGDNRPVSKDSRIVGPIESGQIYGKHVLVLMPFEKIGLH